MTAEGPLDGATYVMAMTLVQGIVGSWCVGGGGGGGGGITQVVLWCS